MFCFISIGFVFQLIAYIHFYTLNFMLRVVNKIILKCNVSYILLGILW